MASPDLRTKADPDLDMMTKRMTKKKKKRRLRFC
jgi:hypothetical protein